jgi:uncharacterized coiled-coil DUF342 family protein
MSRQRITELLDEIDELVFEKPVPTRRNMGQRPTKKRLDFLRDWLRIEVNEQFIELFAEIDAVTAERDEARLEAVTARREGFEAARRMGYDDLGFLGQRFDTFEEYERHLGEVRADHERAVRVAQAEEKEVGNC